MVKKRLFFSTGYFHTVMITSLIQQLAKENIANEVFEDYLFIINTNQNIDKNISIAKLLHNFTEIQVFNMEKYPTYYLPESISKHQYDYIYFDDLGGITYNQLITTVAHANTVFIKVFEGLDIKPNPTEKTMDYYIPFPISYRIPNVNFKLIKTELILETLKKLNNNVNYQLKGPFILIILSQTNTIIKGNNGNTEQSYQYMIDIMNHYINQGYYLYIKYHPRALEKDKADFNQYVINNIIHNDRVIDLESIYPDILITEQLLLNNTPKILLGSYSTTLYMAKYLFAINTFMLWYLNYSLINNSESKLIQSYLFEIPRIAEFIQQDTYNEEEYIKLYNQSYNLMQNLLKEQTNVILYLRNMLNILSKKTLEEQSLYITKQSKKFEDVIIKYKNKKISYLFTLMRSYILLHRLKVRLDKNDNLNIVLDNIKNINYLQNLLYKKTSIINNIISFFRLIKILKQA